MPRLKLDPFSPSGVSIASTTIEVVRQAPGYVSNKVTGLITAGSNVTITGNGTDSSPYSISSSGTGGTTSDATTTSKGIIQLAGDLAGTAALPILKDTIGSSGTSGSSGTVIPVISYDTKGRITALSSAAVSSSGLTLTESQVTNLTTDLAAKQATLSLTTTGTSGAATLVGATLNIPQYSGGGGTTLPTDAAGWLHDNGSGTLAWTTPVKADVGLGNVDNTADTAKPVSTAQQTALDGKVSKTGAESIAGVKTFTSPVKVSGANGDMTLTSDTDGGEYNIGVSATGTLALFGSSTATLDVNLLDGAFKTASIVRMSNAGVLQNTDLTGTGNTFPTFNQNTTGSAAKWTTPRTLAGNSVDGSANATFANKFIVQGTADAGLSSAQFLGALSTGLLKNTTTTGVLSTATSGTDYAPGTSALGTGILKSTTTTGALTIAVAADFPTLNQNTTGTATNITGTLAIAQGGTGATANTGTGNNVLATSPSLTTPTIGSAGANLSGSTSGTTIVKAAAAASGTLTLPAATDTLVGKATTDVFTNKDLTSTTNIFPTGSVVQVVSTNFSAVATGTTLIPTDDTIPQITEGTEFMTITITPKATTNLLIIEATFFGAYSVVERLQIALFQDATANALAGAGNFISTANTEMTIPLRHRMLAGTTSATTFRIRAGANAAGTVTFNGTAGTRRFGGITMSNMTITEIKA